MNRDKALSSTYTTVLKFHAKVIGSSPPGSFGPLEKNMAKKKNGEATLWTKTRKKKKKMTMVSCQVLTTVDQVPSKKYLLCCKNYLEFLVFSHFLTFDNKK